MLKSFNFTVEGTFTSIRECLSAFKDERDIAGLYAQFEESGESGCSANRSFLVHAQALLEERLRGPLSEELLLLALWINNASGLYEKNARLLRQFLEISGLSLPVIAWVRWHIIDNLAMARKNQEVVIEQQAFLLMLRALLPAHTCLFALEDGTQMMSWFRSGNGVAWRDCFEDLIAHVDMKQAATEDLFTAYRTMAHLSMHLQDEQRFYHYTHCIRELVRHDLPIDKYIRYSGEATILEIDYACGKNNLQHARQRAEEIRLQLDLWEPQMNSKTLVRQFRRIAHNTAAPLYFARQYDLAIPLFRRAILHGIIPHDAYIWVAASLFAEHQNLEEILPFVKEASQRYSDGGNAWDDFSKLPELQSIRHDPQFREACRTVIGRISPIIER